MRLVSFKGYYTNEININPEQVVAVYPDKIYTAMSEKDTTVIVTVNGSYTVRDTVDTVTYKLLTENR